MGAFTRGIAKAYAKSVAKKSTRGAEKQAIKDAAIAAGKTEKQAANEANAAMAKKAGKSVAVEKMDVGQSRKDSSFTRETDVKGNKTLSLSARDLSTGKMVSMKKPTDKTSPSRSVADRQNLRKAGESMYKAGVTKQAKKDVAKVAGAAAAAGSVYAATKENKKPASAKTATSTSKTASDERMNKGDYPTYKKKTESAAGFREAFKKAKDAGKKTFTFEGRKYNTKDK